CFSQWSLSSCQCFFDGPPPARSTAARMILMPDCMGSALLSGSLLVLVPVASREIVDETADAARGSSDGRSLAATGHSADECPSAGASADDQRILLPRPLFRVRRIRSCLDDGGRSSDIVP